MATRKYDSLMDLKKGSYNWKVKVRVIRFWRGMTKEGEVFKGFNLLLLDDKGDRMHAFVPGSVATTIQKKIHICKIHCIQNFQVKEYKAEEKFRCVHNDTMLVFTNHTHIELLKEIDAVIDKNAFDFYDLADMKSLANDNTYLTDVIGVVKVDEKLINFTNKNGFPQSQFKFQISDGRTIVNVTLWDSLAQHFENCLTKDHESPLIMIIASARIGFWQDAVDISNVPATIFYLNYQHESVLEMRQMLKDPQYAHLHSDNNKKKMLKFYTIADIHQFQKEYMETEVICQVKIISVEAISQWYLLFCTTCNRQIELIDGKSKCIICNRNVTYPHKRFEIATECADNTGKISIILSDRQVRTVIGKNVYELEEMEEMDEKMFPKLLYTMKNLDCTVKILIKEGNLNKQLEMYSATDLYIGHKQDDDELEIEVANSQVPSSSYQANALSTSSCHLDGLSQMNFDSPA